MQFRRNQPWQGVAVPEYVADQCLEGQPRCVKRDLPGASRCAYRRIQYVPRFMQRMPAPVDAGHLIARFQDAHARSQASAEQVVLTVSRKHRIDIHIVAKAGQCLDLFCSAEQKTMRVKWRLQPRSIKLGDIHAELQPTAVNRNQLR